MSVDRCARAVNFYASLSSAAKRRPPPSSLLHSCIVRSTASNRISSNSPGQNQLYSHRQRRSYSGFTASINSEQDGYRRVALDQSEEARYESLSTAEIYEALRQHARLGEHSLVHNAIDCLVRRRGERPNLRLYSALILAELHPQSGSSYGLERLLNEMKEDGIAIDSGICHDVLKVYHLERLGYPCITSLTEKRIGASCPSRLSTPIGRHCSHEPESLRPDSRISL